MYKYALPGLLVFSATPVLAEGKPVVSRSGLDIRLGGNIEYEFVDVEGKGGFSSQDASSLRPSQRSPYIAMDEASIKMDIKYSDTIDLYLKYKFSGNDANVDINVLTIRFPEWNARLELGRDYPIVEVDQKTEVYPLIGTAFWKGRENHLALFKDLSLGEEFKGEVAMSVGPKRPLGGDSVAEDSSFKMLVYDSFAPKDGQTEEWGLSLKMTYDGISAQAFGYYGRLIDDFDWKSGLSQAISEYNELGDESDKTHYWYGSRFEAEKYSMHFRTEYIYAKDGLLPREGQYTQISYIMRDIWGLKKLEPLFRYDVLNVMEITPVNGNSLTWDRQMTTFALLLDHNDFIKSKIEYYDIEEKTGNKATNKAVDNNEFVYQLNVSF